MAAGKSVLHWEAGSLASRLQAANDGCEMEPGRKRLITDLIFVVIGLGGISVAFGVLGNDIAYAPNDVRSQPWFDPLLFSIQIAIALIFLTTGVARLLHDYRNRRN
jgi:hypothetical protein